MAMEIFQEKLKDLKSILSEEQLMNIHPRSVYNFLKHFKYLESEIIKNQVSEYLNDYFLYIESKDFILTKDESDEIYQLYLVEIGSIYNYHLRFKVYMEPKWEYLLQCI